MREYRKRMKQDTEIYQEARQRRKYVASSLLPKRDKLKRNAKYLQRHRLKKKIEREIIEIDRVHHPT
jgi:hypothetical protein